MTTAALRPRDERRRATEVRLLDAALAVFRERGYDAATTGEMARVAGVAAGTFYVHFRDKRAAFEALAHRAAHELLVAWRAALTPAMPAAAAVATGLRLAADFWRAAPELARLLLEGGPSLGSLGHLRLVDELAGTLAGHPVPADTTPRSLALLLAGLGIEIGRVVAARPAATSDVDDLLRLAERLLAEPHTRRRPRR
jgi:AcrR family transcriptional regulator